MNTDSHKKKITLIDGHVHIYECFDVAALLDSAYLNFSIQAYDYDPYADFDAVLLLTETASDNWFHHVRDAGGVRLGPWSINPLPEDTLTVSAVRDSGETLLIIAGRQIITSEGLEVLALMTDNQYADGNPIEDVLKNLYQQDILTALPWGVGKWLGKRGRVVKRVIDSHTDGNVLLGDNSGRPAFWPFFVHFKNTSPLHMKILPGTDPLPIALEASKPGSYGCVLNMQCSESMPSEKLKAALRDPEIGMYSYGKPEKVLRFIKNQIQLRLN